MSGKPLSLAHRPCRALRTARREVHADFLAKMALGFGLVGAARLLGLLRLSGLTGSVVGDAAVAFAIAVALAAVAWRLRAPRDLSKDSVGD